MTASAVQPEYMIPSSVKGGLVPAHTENLWEFSAYISQILYKYLPLISVIKINSTSHKTDSESRHFILLCQIDASHYEQ